MVQNHLFQLLALTAMEPPIAFDPDAVRDERVKVLNAIPPLSVTDIARDAVRAQYGSAADGSGVALTPNQLVLRIQPDEGIALGFEAKVPGPRVRLGTVPNTGYETLLYDTMTGDSTHFHRVDIVEAG
jgi:glucose-6-phosphate 1-dehydrogenase